MKFRVVTFANFYCYEELIVVARVSTVDSENVEGGTNARAAEQYHLMPNAYKG
jgi:hypothetical protein